MPQCCALLTEFSCGKLALIPFAFCRSPFGLLHELSCGKLAESFVKTTKTRDIFFKTCVYFCSHFCFSHKNHTKKAAELVEAAVYGFPSLNKMQSEVSDGFTATNRMPFETSDGLSATDKILPEASDALTANDKVLSEVSDGLPATNRMPSETSDGLPAIEKLLSEASYTPPQFGKYEFGTQETNISEFCFAKLGKQGFALRHKAPSETSDGFIATDGVLSETSDGLPATDGMQSETSDTFTAISKHEFNKQGFVLRRNDRRAGGGRKISKEFL